jgi:hypothetical protein
MLDFRGCGATYVGEACSWQAAMTGIEIFAFIALPLLIAAGGVAVAYFYDSGRPRHLHPGE